MLLIATAPEPRSQASRYCRATETSLSSPALVILAPGHPDVEQLVSSHPHLLAAPLLLVRAPPEHSVEDLLHHRHEIGMCHPGAVVAGIRLAPLVLPDLREGGGVDLRVASAGNERRHPADGMGVAPVAGVHQQLGIRAHERHGHGELRPVRQDELRTVPEVLDHAEQVVPAARVEPGRVVPQLVQDLVHLERGEDRLDQDRGPYGAAGQGQRVLGGVEHVVPQPRLEMAFQLRQVKIRPAPAGQQLARGVKEVEPEVHQARRHRQAVQQDVLLLRDATREAGPRAWPETRRGRNASLRGSRTRVCAARRPCS